MKGRKRRCYGTQIAERDLKDRALPPFQGGFITWITPGVKTPGLVVESLRDKSDTPPFRGHKSIPRRNSLADTLERYTLHRPSSGNHASQFRDENRRCNDRYSRSQKFLKKNFSSRSAEKTGLARAQKIAWHHGCLIRFSSIEVDETGNPPRPTSYRDNKPSVDRKFVENGTQIRITAN